MKFKKTLSSNSKGWSWDLAALLLSLVFFFPLIWMILTSLKTSSEVFQTPLRFFPKSFNFSAYHLTSTQGVGLPRYFLNSVVIAVGTTLLTVLMAIPGAYGLARYKNPLNKYFLLIFLVGQMIPSSVLLAPLFIMFNNISIIDNYLAPIIADATFTIPFSIIILRTYFSGIPKGLEDAAKIDGCNAFTTFTRIMIPITYPGIFVASVMSLFMAWGDLAFSMTFITSEKLKPMSLILYKTMTEFGINWESLMAYSTIIILPIIFLFIFLQKYIVSGLTAGSVKE